MDCRRPIPATNPDRPGPRAAEGYVATLILGFAVPGLASILLALVVMDAGHRPFRVGEVIACQNWGMLAAPLFGWVADRVAGVRPMLVIGLSLTASAFAGLAAERGLSALLASGVLLGMGVGATNMLALLLVARVSPAGGRRGRVAALQWLGGLGTVAGLGAVLSLAHARYPVAGLLCVALFQSVCPLLGVGSSVLATLLAPRASLGALLAGLMADTFGDRSVCPASACIAVASLLCVSLLGRTRHVVSPARAG